MLRPRNSETPRLGFIRSNHKFNDFVDGGAAVGTILMNGFIPVGAEVLATLVTPRLGFTGDTTALLTVGDGTTVDRYNAGTIDVFAPLPNGISAGVPSGDRYHDARVQPLLTITAGTDWGTVDGGEVTVMIMFIRTRGN